jgi:hypothetical protein
MEGEVEADVVERDIADAIATERDTAQSERDSAIAERDNLAQELENAKAKFANAFLSSPQKAKQDNADDIRQDSVTRSFNELFAGRNKYNAN